MKYHVGQKLTVKKGHEHVCGSYEDVENPSYIVITGTYGSSYGYDILDSNGNKIDDCYNCFKDADLIPLKKTLENLEVGDRVKDEDGDEQLVLAVCGNVICLSTERNHTIAETWYTAKELKDDGFTVVGQKDEEVETIEIGGIKYSKEQVEDKLKDLEAVE